MTRKELDTVLIEHSKGTMYHFHRMVEEIFGIFGLTPPQGAVLGTLYEQGECPLTGLSQQLHVTKGALSALCKRMEAQGLLTRRRSKEDERFVYINITPKSAAILRTLEELRQRFYESRAESMDEAEGEEIIRGICWLESYARKTADEFLEFANSRKTDICALLREEQLQ